MNKENKNFERDNMYQGSKAAIYGRPIIYGVISLALAVMGIYSFFNIVKQEASGVVKLRGVTQDVYNFGGKWAVLGSILLASIIVGYRAFLFWKGINKGLKK
jgi:hypothetical protein